jgi:hypothetical protein
MMRARNTAAAAITVIAAAALATPCAWATAPATLLSTAPVAQNSSPPTGAVSGVRSPMEAGSTLSLTIDASDTGSGLASAQASIGGNTASVSLCSAPPCPEAVSSVPLSVGVGGAGSNELVVSVTDAAGNTGTLVERPIEVFSPAPPGSNTVTIGIGNGGPPSSGPPEPTETGGKGGNGGKGGRGEVSGASSSNVCRSPLLAMRLVSRPLRYAMVKKRRIPVLRARRDYTYRGRLTCLLNGRRVSAPTGTVVHVFYKIGRRPAHRSDRGTMTVHKGNLRAILGYSYTSSRTIIFRYGPIDGELVQVKIPIEIAPTHPRRGRHGR